jgi:hypothetical protein
MRTLLHSCSCANGKPPHRRLSRFRRGQKQIRARAHYTAICVVLGCVLGAAQTPEPQDQYDRHAAERVNELSRPLRVGSGAGDQIRRQRDAVTERIREELDRYLSNGVAPNEASGQIQARLRKVLVDHKPNLEYSDAPFARAVDLRAGKSLIVAYTIVRPPHHDSATIRAYRASLGHFQLVSTTGSDFDGYGMFKIELRSPLAGEFWILAWGQAHTFNGRKVRFRVYAFEGEQFRTVWSPDDMFGATVRATQFGFSIDHNVEAPPYEVHDEYGLTPEGRIKLLSR